MSKTSKSLSPEQLLRIVLDAIPIRVFWKDLDSNFIGGNRLFTKDLGVENPEDLVGTCDADFFDDEDLLNHFRDDDLEVMNSKKPKIGIEEPLYFEDQETKWLKTNKVPMINAHGEVIGVLATCEDISEQKKYQQNIERQALIDPLTGIANRRKLQNTVNENTSPYAGLVFIDLDHFKEVNDSLGHAIGDFLLQQVAKRLSVLLPNKDCLIARLGGDEFSLFVPLPNSVNARGTLEALANQILDSLTKVFEIEHHILNLGASIGLTVLKNDSDVRSTGFSEADIAMYAAKESGRNNYKFYNEGMRELAQRKHEIKSLLAKAIENQELSLVYQAQIDSNNQLIGAEALIRWQNEKLGFVSPNEFIPLAEESGLIHAIGKWVLVTALSTLRSWHQTLKQFPNFKMAVNVSSKQFQNKDFPKLVEKALHEFQVSPSRLQLEITESLLIDRQDLAVKSMLKLQKLGISIAIDDFGTGYSSLAYLATLPIDKLKIDRSFVTELHQNSTNRKLVDTLITMSKNLSMDVIAEGVESEQEKHALLALDCFQYQGYLFSKPARESDFRQQYFLSGFSKGS